MNKMKFKRLLCAALAAVLLCVSFSACSSKKEKKFNINNIKVDNAKITEIEREVDEILNLNEFYGSAAISLNNQKVYDKSFGYADPGKENKLDSKSQYQINLLTKQITAAAVLKLEADKKLSLKDKLSKYFYKAENGQYLNGITVGDILVGNVGFGAYTGELRNDQNKWNILRKYFFSGKSDKYSLRISNYIVKHILDHGATKNNPYKTSNYYLLGKIISKVSGMSYSDYVQENIFDKLGMKNSGFVNSRFKISGFDMNNKKWLFSGDYPNLKNFGYMYSAYGVVSCTEDLMKFYSALLSGKLGIDFVKKVKNSYATECCGFNKDGYKISLSGRTSVYCAYVHINIQNNEIVLMLSNSVGKTDVVNTGEEMYDVISSKVNGIILSDFGS